MAHSTSPTFTAPTRAELVSNVATLALLLAFLTDVTAVSAYGAPNVITRSMLGSCYSLAVIVDSTDGMSAPFTLKVSTAPRSRSRVVSDLLVRGRPAEEVRRPSPLSRVDRVAAVLPHRQRLETNAHQRHQT